MVACSARVIRASRFRRARPGGAVRRARGCGWRPARSRCQPRNLVVDGQAPAGDLDTGGRGLDPAADPGQLELPGLRLGWWWWCELTVGSTPRQRVGGGPVGQPVPVRLVDDP